LLDYQCDDEWYEVVVFVIVYSLQDPMKLVKVGGPEWFNSFAQAASASGLSQPQVTLKQQLLTCRLATVTGTGEK